MGMKDKPLTVSDQLNIIADEECACYDDLMGDLCRSCRAGASFNTMEEIAYEALKELKPCQA